MIHIQLDFQLEGQQEYSNPGEVARYIGEALEPALTVNSNLHVALGTPESMLIDIYPVTYTSQLQ